MKYKIALQKSEEGFSVSVAGLPGCEAQRLVEELPENASWDDLMYEVYVRQAVERRSGHTATPRDLSL